VRANIRFWFRKWVVSEVGGRFSFSGRLAGWLFGWVARWVLSEHPLVE